MTHQEQKQFDSVLKARLNAYQQGLEEPNTVDRNLTPPPLPPVDRRNLAGPRFGNLAHIAIG